MCREIKRAKKICNCWTSKGTIILKTTNEQPISVDHESESEIKSLCPDFFLKERDRTS